MAHLKEPNISHQEAGPEFPSVWQLINQTYYVLDTMDPGLTSECWLCYSARPPYYEAIGLQANYTQTKDPNQCRWSQGQGYRLILQEVSGQGTCLGQVPPVYSTLCKQTSPGPIDPSGLYGVPDSDAW